MPQWKAEISQRLDAFLGAENRTLSRSKAQTLIDDGHVRVNGKTTKKRAYRLEPGDEVTVKDDLPVKVSDIKPVDLKLKVLYEDDACMVLQKPAGIAVHPGAGMDAGETTLLHGIAHIFKKQSLPFSEDAVLVHRLDKETTGCILVAKNAAAHITLQKQFETRTVRKLYLALVAGSPLHKAATVDSPIGRSQTDRTKMSVRGVSGVRDAQTTYRVVTEHEKVALLECDLHTGRTHQVRVHLQSIGHPVLGDPNYHSPLSQKLAAEHGIENLCLHAWKLSFQSPADEKTHKVEAPLTKAFTKALESTNCTL